MRMSPTQRLASILCRNQLGRVQDRKWIGPTAVSGGSAFGVEQLSMRQRSYSRFSDPGFISTPEVGS